MANERARVQLRQIAVANRCTVDWTTMRGDGPVRFCGSCRQSVYNLSEMTEAEAERLLARREQLCVRYYHRPDGTIVTSACAATGHRPVLAAGIATALASSAAFVGISAAVVDRTSAQGDHVQVAMGMRLELTIPATRDRAKRRLERERAVADAKPSLAPAPDPAPAPVTAVIPAVSQAAEPQPTRLWPALGALLILVLTLGLLRHRSERLRAPDE